VKAELAGSGWPRTGFMRRTRSDFGNSFAWARRRRPLHALIFVVSLLCSIVANRGGALSGASIDKSRQKIDFWRQQAGRAKTHYLCKRDDRATRVPI
jgi:hypothetical protein